MSSAQSRERWFRRDHLHRAKFALTQVGFVEPGIGLFRQDTGDTLAIKVHPSVTRTIQANGQIFQAVGTQIANVILNVRLAVLELKRWQGLFEVSDVLDTIA